MHVLVINGSPKGQYSITLQTCLYLEKRFPEHVFEYLHAGAKIRVLEENFAEAVEKIGRADLILFAYPVYTFLVPSQLHRFIELLKNTDLDLSGKTASQISTSKHFYDVTAHEFIRENCLDLGLNYIRGLSADMDDLLTEQGRKDADVFFKTVLWSIQREVYEKPRPGKHTAAHRPVEIPDSSRPERKGNIVIVSDYGKEETQLPAMIERFRRVVNKQTEVVNIREFPFRGGCISCFNCAADGTCIYHDGFGGLLRNRIQTADAIVLAFSVRDHSMGSVFKTYDDRQFCNGHRTVTMGVPFGYLVSGNLENEPNLRMVIEARAEVGGNYLAGIATDETDPNAEIDSLAACLERAVDMNLTQPSNFYGVGGMKIFRDLIWQMQGLMKADHRFYRAHGQYDFPQKKPGTMLKMYLVGWLLSSRRIREKAGVRMNEGMIAPYRKVVEKAEAEEWKRENS